MSVIARMQVSEIALMGGGTRIKLTAVYSAGENEPHAEEIEKFFAATPSGSFEAYIRNETAAEQFQPGDHFYVSLEKVPGYVSRFRAMSE